MLTRQKLAKRWDTTERTIDRRRALGLLPWVDLARGTGKRPQIRFKVEDILEYERKARLCPGEGMTGAKDQLDDQNSKTQ